MVLYAWSVGRWREGMVACLVAAQVFVSWEALTSLLYGQSHLLANLTLGQRGSYFSKLTMLPFLANHLGGLMPAVLALGLAALGAGWRTLSGLALVTAGGFGIIAGYDIYFLSYLETPPLRVDFAEIFCTFLGGALTIVTTLVALHLFRRSRRHPVGKYEQRRRSF